MIEIAMKIFVVGLGILGIASIYRAFKGPTAMDRIVAMNMIMTMVVLYIIVFAHQTAAYYYIDVSLVFILAAFIATLCILKFLREGRLL
ncbi:MAG: pH regulation protein F [Dethiobacter sp.]|jgi:multicomponent Na+:H+ antiporter subunit F|nr:MAG: pH regulation protein F [Dethiobacter sp.]